MSKAAFCLATTVSQASRIVADLRSHGFAEDDISVLYSDTQRTRDFVHAHCTKAPEGAAAGAGAGGILGGTVGWLAGMGSLGAPILGPLIAAGPILAALGGLGIGATVGGITGAMVGYGIPEFEAKRYEGKVISGGILVSVHCDGRRQREAAYELFARNGGEDISVADEARADFPVFEARSA